MTNLEKSLILFVLSAILLVTSVALWPLLHQPAAPTVLQAKSVIIRSTNMEDTGRYGSTWADHEAQYRKLVEKIRVTSRCE